MWCLCMSPVSVSCRIKAVHLASFLTVRYKIVKDSGIQTGRSMWMCLIRLRHHGYMLEITYPVVFILIVCTARKLHISRYVTITLLNVNTSESVCRSASIKFAFPADNSHNKYKTKIVYYVFHLKYISGLCLVLKYTIYFIFNL